MNDEMREQCSMWAILPAKVRYDKRLPANAKLLYAEIAAKCNTQNVCYMHNATMAETLGMTPTWVSKLLAQLQALGYIEIHLDYKSRNKGRRIITLTAKPYVYDKAQGGIEQKCKTGIEQKCKTVLAKSARPIENDDTKINPPQAPQGGGECAEEEKAKAEAPAQGKKKTKSTAAWKPERFNAFWKFYPPVNGERPAKGRAVSAWDKLRLDDHEIDCMARYLREKVNSDQWRRGVGIPYASTFLNGRMWETEKAEAQTAPPPLDPEDVREEWT